ncbi:protease inhibitor I42 family protein [Streptomyces sp. NPDC059688]|uniref:protease inhibitor I42 family protein n=1 Tax=Streptomyces sp. NPDC059688 TaxID=3346906 RepID=UPI0036ACB14A
MTARPTLLGSAALVCLLALTGCGAGGGNGTSAASTPASGTPAPTTPATGTPSQGAPVSRYGPRDRTITAVPGEAITLTVPSAATLGQNWYLADPGPDAAVLRFRGERSSGDGSDADGATGGSRSFEFSAVAEGRTTVRLLYCPLHTCTGPGPNDRSTLGPTPDGTASPSPYPTATGTPNARAAYYVFTITVR